MPGKRRDVALFAAALALPLLTATLTLGPIASPATAAGPQPIAGSKPGWAAASADAGPANTGDLLDARIWLAGRDKAGQNAYAQAVSDPRDPAYHRYLPAADFEARFGPTPAQVQEVISWATGQGLRITGSNPHYVAVRASVGAMATAFGTQFDEYTIGGQRWRAPARQASLPAALAAEVLTVTGLDSQPAVEAAPVTVPPPDNHWWPGPCSVYNGQNPASDLPAFGGRPVAWSACGYTPAQLRHAYGMDTSGLTGQGVTVAVVGVYESPTIAADLTRYAQDAGEPLRAGQYRDAPGNGNWDGQHPCGAQKWFTEQTKDVEAVHGMAPDADIVYVGAQDCTPAAFDDALLRVVDGHLADIVNCSWGATSDGYGVAYRAIAHRTFEQAAIEGIGFYFSSGDSGSEDPATAAGKSDGSDRLQVDYPAADPGVTAVGGTSLGVDAAGGYAFEAGWGAYRVGLTTDGRSWTDPPTGKYPQDWTGGSGGGTSADYPQPAYQHGVVPDALNQTLPGGTPAVRPMRVVPDVALDADPFTGMLVGETIMMPDDKSTRYELTRSGGTSLACALFAGIQALAQQAQHGVPLGFANPAIYLRYGTAAYRDVVADPLGGGGPVAWAVNRYAHPGDANGQITTTLSVTGQDGAGAATLRVGPGYDDVTGVGTPDGRYLDSFG